MPNLETDKKTFLLNKIDKTTHANLKLSNEITDLEKKLNRVIDQQTIELTNLELQQDRGIAKLMANFSQKRVSIINHCTTQIVEASKKLISRKNAIRTHERLDEIRPLLSDVLLGTTYSRMQILV